MAQNMALQASPCDRPRATVVTNFLHRYDQRNSRQIVRDLDANIDDFLGLYAFGDQVAPQQLAIRLSRYLTKDQAQALVAKLTTLYGLG